MGFFRHQQAPRVKTKKSFSSWDLWQTPLTTGTAGQKTNFGIHSLRAAHQVCTGTAPSRRWRPKRMSSLIPKPHSQDIEQDRRDDRKDIQKENQKPFLGRHQSAKTKCTQIYGELLPAQELAPQYFPCQSKFRRREKDSHHSHSTGPCKTEIPRGWHSKKSYFLMAVIRCARIFQLQQPGSEQCPGS